MSKTYLNVTFSHLVLLALLGGCEAPVTKEGAGGSEGIIGGEVTNYESWRGVVAVRGVGGGCTGTLIHPEVVLTAGHCLYTVDPGTDYSQTPELIKIKGGPANGELNTFAYGLMARKHPDWGGDISAPGAVDLSMILLDTPILDIESYPVRYGVNPQVNDPGVIVGYGLFDGADSGSGGVHRVGETTVLGVTDALVLAGGETSICIGDSGGPLFTEQDDAWALSGVTSFVLAPPFGDICDPAAGGYHVNTLTHREWISDVLEEWTGEALPWPTEQDTDTDTDSAQGGDAGAEGDTDTMESPPTPGDTLPTSSSAGCSFVPASPARASSILSILFELEQILVKP